MISLQEMRVKLMLPKSLILMLKATHGTSCKLDDVTALHSQSDLLHDAPVE